MEAAEEERALEEAVGMLVALEGGGGRTGLGGDGCRWLKEGMGLVLVPDGGGVGWEIVAPPPEAVVALLFELAFFETMCRE